MVKNCDEYRFWMLGCYFYVQEDTTPLSSLLPSVSMFSSVLLISGLLSPDVHHALKFQFQNMFFFSTTIFCPIRHH